MLVMFTLFYRSAAVIIREVARRTGRGWPTILLLALAYGIFEEGVVDQSLFNPNFAGERLLDFGHIPVIDTPGPAPSSRHPGSTRQSMRDTPTKSENM